MILFFIFGIAILLILIFAIYSNFFPIKKKQVYSYAKELNPPPWADVETVKLFKQFNTAWSSTIEDTVNIRVFEKEHHLSNSELSERWYELKKFLFLAGISKGLPMFSEKVDELWHFFLEEKEIYHEFCSSFIGEQIEHHPHGTPKNLPIERAWFDILYLSFFNISSHSYLWGKFIQNKQEHVKWLAQIIEDSKSIRKSFARLSSRSESVQTLDAFLQFSSKQLTGPNHNQEKRVLRSDGYWYGGALLSLHSEVPFPKKQQKRDDIAYSDGSAGFVASYDEQKEWKEIVALVNTFEDGTNSGSTHDSSPNNGDSDAGSSCSSCSGCSS